jgi:nitrogen fixation/metabolism regulation signal transduction histidine kinase
VLSDVSRALRDEERVAWQRLVRVLSHEINNSLAPIQSLAQSLTERIKKEGRGDGADDLRQGLAVIGSRAESLARFMAAYAKLARLPAPTRRGLDVGDWVRRVAELETRVRVAVVPGPEAKIEADGDQLDQLLINLVRNAADACAEAGGGAVEVGWEVRRGRVEVWVRDEGPGLPDTGNLFVPFFTTKPAGTGIGLALSRQIAEAHGGGVSLSNRKDRSGAEARLVLPAPGGTGRKR